MGYISKNSSSDMLVKALDTVAGGGTFIQQELVSSFIALKEIYGVLSKKERTVVELLTPEITNKEIAEAMGISTHSVENYIYSLYDKTFTSNRKELLEKLGKI